MNIIKIEVSEETLKYHLYGQSKELLKGHTPQDKEDKDLVKEDVQSLNFMYILADGRSKVLIGELIDRLEFEDV